MYIYVFLYTYRCIYLYACVYIIFIYVSMHAHTNMYALAIYVYIHVYSGFSKSILALCGVGARIAQILEMPLEKELECCTSQDVNKQDGRDPRGRKTIVCPYVHAARAGSTS